MNLSAINHKQFDRLVEITGCCNKATLLDKLLFWWQGSTYKLDDDKIWFTRSIKDISEASGIKQRTVERYLKFFTERGYIEKCCILLRKKNLYIRISEKLLALIKTKTPVNNDSKQPVGEAAPESNCSHLKQNGVTGHAKMAVSNIMYIEPIVDGNSTISDKGIVNNSHALNQKQSLGVEKQIGERLSTRFKNYIQGVMKNLQTQHGLKFSNPDKVFAEIVFSATNTEHHFPMIKDMVHRINNIAKLIRERRWKTPKGFYNHWDIGKDFREKEEINKRKYQSLKEADGVSEAQAERAAENFAPTLSKTQEYEQRQYLKKLQSEFRELQLNLASQEKYLKQAQVWFDEGRGGVNQTMLESTAISIAKLYQQMEDKRGLIHKNGGQVCV